jgi:hypothetical protein
MPRIKEYKLTPEQQFTAIRIATIERIAKEAGFDDDAFANTEFSLVPFFELIVEECARIAEDQTYNFTGENKESSGCQSSATAIRTFGKLIGNYEKQKTFIR